MPDSLDKFQQENLLTLLCWDTERAKLVRNAVDLHLFEGLYREIATKCYHYLDKYGEPPSTHLPDELIDQLEDPTEGDAYRQILDLMQEARVQVNAKYVIDKLHTFVRRQKLKVAILEAAELVQSEAPEADEKAERILADAAKTRLEMFEPGLHLGDLKQSLAFLDNPLESFPTGIKALDDVNVGPVRGGLHMFIGAYGVGKSWYLINLAKRALSRRLRVLHVSLEMSERSVSQRYFQALLAVPKRPKEYTKTVLELDEGGQLLDLTGEKIKFSFALDDKHARTKLMARLKPFRRQLGKIVIKQFPTSKLTIQMLEAYLESLEVQSGFLPDLLIIDYADLMKLDAANLRISLGHLVSQLRGIAVERNLAIATASQSNRAGWTARTVTASNVAEDASKIATADSVVTYSQTAAEQKLGTARLLVEKVREDESKFAVIISQNYGIGQFVLGSVRMKGDAYWDLVNSSSEEEAEEKSQKSKRRKGRRSV